ANLEGEMGLEQARAFPFLDYVVVGEGDVLWPSLLRCLASGTDPDDLPGLLQRTRQGVVGGGQAPPVRDLDALPTPNYDEFFDRAQRLGLTQQQKHHAWRLPFESSRGCWWGQKHHCTFCGLNGLGMGYRAKSPQRALAELAELARKHGVYTFFATDNILDPRYLKDLFLPLEEAKTAFQFFYEVKANLTREQLRTLHRGSVRILPPGIESLSSLAHGLMRKACTMVQNVRLIKWARYYGIKVTWNLLWGFPGETEEDYRQELAVLQRISHLEPPADCIRI